MTSDPPPPEHAPSAVSTPRTWHGAHHVLAYAPRAFRFIGREIVGINFVPLAAPMRAWLLRQGDLPVAVEDERGTPGAYSNPYTYSGLALAICLAEVVNDHYAFCQGEEAVDDPLIAAVTRLRLYNELLLYVVRVGETAIKQLLYCTQLPDRRYERFALGQLLEAPCPNCRKENGKQPHSVSLVASLAHPFRLCHEFTHCAMDHLALVNRLRNGLAAHSGTSPLHVLPADETRKGADEEGRFVMAECLHLLEHLAKVELAMLDDLARQGAVLEQHRLDGLAAADANFHLVPGEPVPMPSPAPR